MSNTTGMALQGTLNVLAGTTGLGADEAARRMVATAPYTGTGSPEGVVTATVGAKYIDSAATCGAVEWTKMSGSSNTGWVVTVGDTGWRDVTGSLESGATAVVWRMRRVNNTVSHQIYNAAHGGAAIYTLPAGFNCLGTSGSSVPISKADGTVGAFFMDGASGCSLQPVGMESYTSALYVVSYTTTDAWPTSLPGSAYTP